jgi:hypothetical protein
MMIPRQALPLKTEQQGQEKTPQSPTTPVDLSSLRNLHAWVLLGEPGAGKTTAFTEEATACGGLRVSVAEFIHPGNTLDDWQNKVLFLDGLDEITGDIQTTLISIRNKLKKLNHPKFRLSCRAADWQGALCLEKLHDATPAQTGRTTLSAHARRCKDLSGIRKATPGKRLAGQPANLGMDAEATCKPMAEDQTSTA